MYISSAYSQLCNLKLRLNSVLNDQAGDDFESDEGYNAKLYSSPIEDDDNGSSTETDAGEEDTFDITDYQPIDLSNISDPEEIWGDPYEELGIDHENPLAGQVGFGDNWEWEEERCEMIGCEGSCAIDIPETWPVMESPKNPTMYAVQQPTTSSQNQNSNLYSSFSDQFPLLHPGLPSFLQEHLRRMEIQNVAAATRSLMLGTSKTAEYQPGESSSGLNTSEWENPLRQSRDGDRIEETKRDIADVTELTDDRMRTDDVDSGKENEGTSKVNKKSAQPILEEVTNKTFSTFLQVDSEWDGSPRKRHQSAEDQLKQKRRRRSPKTRVERPKAPKNPQQLSFSLDCYD